jgi:hypothetical protein
MSISISYMIIKVLFSHFTGKVNFLNILIRFSFNFWENELINAPVLGILPYDLLVRITNNGEGKRCFRERQGLPRF